MPKWAFAFLLVPASYWSLASSEHADQPGMLEETTFSKIVYQEGSVTVTRSTKAPWYAGFSTTDGEVYQSTSQAWTKLLDKGSEKWYNTSLSFWNGESADLEGVMAGRGHLHDADIRDSLELITSTFEQLRGKHWLKSHGRLLKALDASAGVGRTAVSLLLPLFGQVELNEPVKAFIDKAKEAVESSKADFPGHNATSFYDYRLQDFPFFQQKSYDVIWVQWCLLYMPDTDVIEVLQRMRAALPKGGVIFVKENVEDHGFVVDKAAGHMIRSKRLMEILFNEAKLQTVMHRVQQDFDANLHEVHMWALQPGEQKTEL